MKLIFISYLVESMFIIFFPMHMIYQRGISHCMLCLPLSLIPPYHLYCCHNIHTYCAGFFCVLWKSYNNGAYEWFIHTEWFVSECSNSASKCWGFQPKLCSFQSHPYLSIYLLLPSSPLSLPLSLALSWYCLTFFQHSLDHMIVNKQYLGWFFLQNFDFF